MNKKKQNIKLIDSPLYNYWQALYLSFSSRNLYVDISKRWRGYGFIYLLLLSFIVSIPLSAKLVIQYNNYLATNVVEPLMKLPVIYIQNGDITINEPMPYYIKNKFGEVTAIVDTTGVVNKFDSSFPDLIYLFTKNSVLNRQPISFLSSIISDHNNEYKIYNYQFDKKTNEVFDGKKFIEGNGVFIIKLIVNILIYPVLGFFIFVLISGIVVIFVFVGQLASIIIFKFTLNLKDSFRIFIVASTPAIFLFFASLIVNYRIPGGVISYVALLSFYYSLAIISIRAMSGKMVHA